MFIDNKEEWEEHLKNTLGFSYIPIKSLTKNAMHLMIFAHQSIYSQVKDIDISYVPCGVGNIIYNKGAIAIGFKIVDKSFLFVCCHLACNYCLLFI